jgi:hypothetical protein
MLVSERYDVIWRLNRLWSSANWTEPTEEASLRVSDVFRSTVSELLIFLEIKLQLFSGVMPLTGTAGLPHFIADFAMRDKLGHRDCPARQFTLRSFGYSATSMKISLSENSSR